MGTRASLVTYDSDRTRGLARLDSFVEILEDTERELSTWRADSAVGRLNRQPVGLAHTVPPGLCRLLDDLFFWQRDTGGAFDPAVGALVAAYDIRGSGRWPSAAELADARRRSGFSRFRFDSRICSITREADAVLEEGGFGKGEALDRIGACVSVRDTAPWFVDLGGQVLVSGRPAGTAAWQVAIAHPLRRDQPVVDVDLTSGSLSTSSGSERDLEAGPRIGHILDPRTGLPASFGGSVSVWHERALVADILSTALYVMGPDEGLAWAEARDIAACFLVPSRPSDASAAIDVRATHAFRSRFFRSARE